MNNRWRGFNLIDLFSTSARWIEQFPMTPGRVPSRDIELIADLGFNFVRLPFSYLYFAKGAHGSELDESRLTLLDDLLEKCTERGIHLSLNLHRAPGYCINEPSYFDFPETTDLFSDEAPASRFVEIWSRLAERYRGVSSERLSFDLLNEPEHATRDQLLNLYRRTAQTVWNTDPQRKLVFESVDVYDDIEEIDLLQDSRAVVSPHMYAPGDFTHFGAPWAAPNDHLEVPTWPWQPRAKPGAEPLESEEVWDRSALEQTLSRALRARADGMEVHVGEMGAFSKVPHRDYLAWMEDVLGILHQNDIGWALWNFRGPFGVLDTGRSDVNYESWQGHALDRDLLSILARS